MAYSRVNWKEIPDTTTPINAYNLNTMDRGIADNASNIADLGDEIEKQRVRLNELARLPQGSTSGDAELADIRVGWDGDIYDNAGEAVRTQFENTYSEIDRVRNLSSRALTVATSASNGVNQLNDSVTDLAQKQATDRAMIKSIVGDFYEEQIYSNRNTQPVPSNAFPFAELQQWAGYSRKLDNQLIDSKPDRFDSNGRNLFDKDNADVMLNYMFDDNGNSSWGGANWKGISLKVTQGVTYTFNSNAGEIRVFSATSMERTNLSKITTVKTNYVTFTATTNYVFINFYTADADYLSKTTLSIGNTATPYTPYFDKHYPIPQAIQDLPDYGIGIGDKGNTVVVAPKTYHNMKSVDLGTINDWQPYSGYFYANSPSDSATNTAYGITALTLPYNNYMGGLAALPDNSVLMNSTQFSSQTKYIIIKDSSVKTVEELKTKLQGVMLHYEATSGGSDYEAKLYYRLVGEYRATSCIGIDSSGTLKNIGVIPNMASQPLTNPTIMSIYDTKGLADARNSTANSITAYANTGYVRNDAFSTAQEYSAYLSQHPLTIYYELATPEIYDITDIVPDDFEIMQVEGGGTFGPHCVEEDNGYDCDVAYDILYQLKA